MFEDIKIIDLDTSKTIQINPNKAEHDFYYKLSPSPPSDWAKFFDKQHQSNMKIGSFRKAHISRECYALLSKGAALTSIKMANTTKCRAASVSGNRS